MRTERKFNTNLACLQPGGRNGADLLVSNQPAKFRDEPRNSFKSEIVPRPSNVQIPSRPF